MFGLDRLQKLSVLENARIPPATLHLKQRETMTLKEGLAAFDKMSQYHQDRVCLLYRILHNDLSISQTDAILKAIEIEIAGVEQNNAKERIEK